MMCFLHDAVFLLYLFWLRGDACQRPLVLVMNVVHSG